MITSLREGVLPQWNPYANCGMPFVADIQSAVFYPLNWLLIFFVKNGRLIYKALELQLILHAVLGGFFMFVFVKKIGISFQGSIFTAVAFGFSGFLITKIAQATLFCTFIYLPLILYFTHRSITEARIKYAIYGGLAFAISIFAGGPQFSLHIFYYTLTYSIFVIFTKQTKQWYYNLIFPTILFLVGIGIAAVQIFPTIEYSGYTVREFLSYGESTRDSMPFSRILTFLVPKLFGSATTGLTATDTVAFWGENGVFESYWETCAYLGILPLLLIFFAYRDKGKRKPVILFSILTIIFFLAAMGKYTPVYWFFYHVVPGISKFRIAGRFLGLFTFSALLLSGIGFDQVFKNNDFKRVPRILYVFMVTCISFFLLLLFDVFKNINPHTMNQGNYSNMIWQSSISLIFIATSTVLIFLFARRKDITKRIILAPLALLFIDLFFFGKDFNPYIIDPSKQYQLMNPIIQFLNKEYQRGIFRVNTRSDEGTLFMDRNAGDVYRFELLQGYNPLGMQNFSEMLNLPLQIKLDLFNTKYTIKMDTVWTDKSVYFWVALNQGYLPRASMRYSWVVASGKEETFRLLTSIDFDYRNILILEQDPGIQMPKVPPENKVTILRKTYNNLEVEIETAAPGILFLSELYYPCWHAFLDGKPVKIMAADYAFRALVIPAGAHKAQLVYQSSAYEIGKMLTVITLIVSVLLLVLEKKFTRQAKLK